MSKQNPSTEDVLSNYLDFHSESMGFEISNEYLFPTKDEEYYEVLQTAHQAALETGFDKYCDLTNRSMISFPRLAKRLRVGNEYTLMQGMNVSEQRYGRKIINVKLSSLLPFYSISKPSELIDAFSSFYDFFNCWLRKQFGEDDVAGENMDHFKNYINDLIAKLVEAEKLYNHFMSSNKKVVFTIMSDGYSEYYFPDSNVTLTLGFNADNIDEPLLAPTKGPAYYNYIPSYHCDRAFLIPKGYELDYEQYLGIINSLELGKLFSSETNTNIEEATDIDDILSKLKPIFNLGQHTIFKDGEYIYIREDWSKRVSYGKTAYELSSRFIK